MIQVPEVLAPAGDWERLEAAVQYGADAVYLGGDMFGMRSSPKNFAGDELEKAVEFCHKRGVKVYVTCNTLPRNDEADRLPAFIEIVAGSGADALIVADIGVLLCAKRVAPALELHISTQTGVVNYLTAGELYNMGASRVVLARELNLTEIAEIRRRTPPELELEAFVHGAMCMSFSGRCVISNYLTGRDANRGACTQPCRWSYHLMEEKRPGQYYPVMEDEKGSYILNAQDLSMLPYIDKLAQAGVSSFKIEGRAKSAYYVAVVTNAYRCAVDLYRQAPNQYKAPQWLLEETLKVSHRQYSTGFYFPDTPPGQYYQSGGYVRQWDVVATVTGWNMGVITCLERNRLAVGEWVEVLQPGQQPFRLLVEQISNEQGEAVEVACHPMEVLRIPCEKQVAPGAIIRRER